MAAVSMRILCFIDVNDLDDDTIVATWESYTTYGSRLRSICSDYVLTPSRNAMLTEKKRSRVTSRPSARTFWHLQPWCARLGPS